MSDKIRAAIRVRPFLESQVKNGYTNNRIQLDQKKKQIIIQQDNTSQRVFHFDHLFSQQTTQNDIYINCKVDNLIQKALEGYHSTIFAYGQTGSGKTYTMQGTEQVLQQGNKKELDGLIPKIISNLFNKISKSNNRTYTISVSFLQIYNERIYDLLNPASINPKNISQFSNMGGLRLRWNKNQQFSVQNLFVYECKNAEELNRFFISGLKNRISCAHKLNMQSSRSHSILTIRVESFSHQNPQSILASKIELVDLAGSQRIGLTGTQGKLAKESIDINKSLFTLRQVITTLSDMSKNRKYMQSRKDEKERTYVPYRDSKLTSILKQSIGGNSFCLMIACINPNDSFLDQNISTLTYATKASYITNQPTINDDPRTKIINDLKNQVKQLTNELSKANKHIEIVSTMGNAGRQQNLMIHQVQPKMNQNYDQFSQRLVESINMVRQLLKGNKELREQLQINNRKLDEKDIELCQLIRQNQILNEKLNGNFVLDGVQESRRSSQLKHRNSNISNNLGGSTNNYQLSNGHIYGYTTTNTKNNFNFENAVQIKQYYMNERGIDSIPTNFNRREINSAQEKRLIQSRGNGTSVQGRSTDRHAITAKITKRSWMGKNSEPKKFLSFYNDPSSREY